MQTAMSKSSKFDFATVDDEREAVQQRFTFLLECILRTIRSPSRQTEVLLFVPSRPGHLLRSDILDIRLADCVLIQNCVNLASPTRTFSGGPGELPCNIHAALAAAAGACFVSQHVPHETLRQEFSNRLSLPLMQSGTRPRRTIAILECGKSPASGLGIFKAAKALNVGILALDKPGHWMSKPEYASWRDAFIPLDRTPNEGLADRIVAAVQEYGQAIDGIVSFFDPLLPSTAAAAAKLGLPAAPVSAYEIASDKHKTSHFEGHAAYRVSSLEEALATARQETSKLAYPLIVKPCSGWGSEGVFRVDSESDLIQAIGSIDFGRHGSSFVMEKYCEGPEVDANLVLCDGELLFFEVSDDFPKDADGSPARDGNLQTFIEVANVLPSALPADEQEMLKDSLHQSLLRLGFRTGFYHLEARVQGSRARYEADQNGLVDLVVKEENEGLVDDAPSCPSAWLLEINARPPGLQASWASRATYGIDFWGLSLCFAMGETSTARALSVPFASNHQYWCQIVFIPVPRGGVFESDDICQELIQRHPELAGNISRSLCFFAKGDHVPDPSSGILTWVAYYLVISRKSRRDLMEVAQLVRRETRFIISSTD